MRRTMSRFGVARESFCMESTLLRFAASLPASPGVLMLKVGAALMFSLAGIGYHQQHAVPAHKKNPQDTLKEIEELGILPGYCP